FFFSSRRRHTRFSRDWSSDVCSSDLATQVQITPETLNNPELFKQFQDNQANLTSALSRLMAVVERYPDLKANQNFLALQSQLEGTENRIAVARRDYIEAVRVYNTGLKIGRASCRERV